VTYLNWKAPGIWPVAAITLKRSVDNVSRSISSMPAQGLLGFEGSDGFFNLNGSEENFFSLIGVKEGQEFLIDSLLKIGVKCTVSVVNRDTEVFKIGTPAFKECVSFEVVAKWFGIVLWGGH